MAGDLSDEINLVRMKLNAILLLSVLCGAVLDLEAARRNAMRLPQQACQHLQGISMCSGWGGGREVG